MSITIAFPRQQLSFSKKTKKWRKECVDWGESRTFFNYSPVRHATEHKKINYDLINGRIHMEDITKLINPSSTKGSFIPSQIQHYPIINAKLGVLRGEESKRVFDWRVVVTNPTAVSEIEENKKAQLIASLQEIIENKGLSEDETNQELDRLNDYYTYQWQDFREIRANALLNHYIKELDMATMFNVGFMDGMTVGEEIYFCDIVGGEPTIEKVNPLKIRVFKSGSSNRIEDADVVIMEDYWSPGRIIDTYYDSLTTKDVEYLENLPDNFSEGNYNSMGQVDERRGLINAAYMPSDEMSSSFFFDPTPDGSIDGSLMPYDLAGNVRVIRMFWKSRRKIKKVKRYNPETGDEEFEFYPETYICNEALGEEEQIFWINEAWEGTKIGESIYVNMRPKVVQYNRLSDPSRCHFGIVGSIYNINDSRPYSLVDMMKPYSYWYDIIHDRLNKMMARNWGKILQIDLAKVPKGWNIDKWMYFAQVNGLAVINSFNEGNIGAATGKLAGALNNASTGVIDADWGNNIQQYINLLEFIKMEMSDVAGISKQREGQISNRETVGGVERATLQSSHITEWLFLTHDSVKKRALECFLETAKAAIKGRSKKFEYILPDHSKQIITIDGDDFAECDYGLVVDNSDGTQKLNSNLDVIVQAALQNQMASLSTIMKIYSTTSLAEKQRMIESEERRNQQRADEAQQQQMEAAQQQLEAQQQAEIMKMEHESNMNTENNETKIIVAQIGHGDSNNDGIQEPDTDIDRDKLRESIRQFNEELELKKKELEFKRDKQNEDAQIKRAAAKNRNTNN